MADRLTMSWFPRPRRNATVSRRLPMVPGLVTTVLPKPMPPLLVVQVTTQQDHDVGEQGGVRLWTWLTVDPDTKLVSHHQHSKYVCVLVLCKKKEAGWDRGTAPPRLYPQWIYRKNRTVDFSAMDYLLWQWAAYGIEPALSFGFYAVDDAAQAVCGHDIAEQKEF